MKPFPFLCTLQFEATADFDSNFQNLTSLLSQAPAQSVSLAPEVCLSGFAYDRMEEAAGFSEASLKKLLPLTRNKALGLTLIVKENSGYVNRFYLLHDGKVHHTQDKHKLFPLGDEHDHFTAGGADAIRPFAFGGIHCACLLCFEIRFSELWHQILGAELIFVPAQWSALRKEQFETLTRALAISNQAFVIASNGDGREMAGGSGIITPFGKEYRDDSQAFLHFEPNWEEVAKMRRYIKIGLEGC